MSLKHLSGRGAKPPWDRFAMSYKPDQISGCWVWLGRERNGYGAIKVDGKVWKASRYSWHLNRGTIPPGMWVLHKCDNPMCVNPEHLFLGTGIENVADKVNKGRQARGEKLSHKRASGERNGNSRINGAQAASIRSDPRPQRTIAIEYGISQKAVWQIKNRRTWND